MIHVDMQPEPAKFDGLVRQPGKAFLSAHPNPTTEQWDANSYWRGILRDIRRAYGKVCAYSCHWVPADTGGRSVEHFVPKHREPSLAYEWSNYRFICSTLNARKRDYIDVLDPFGIEDGWFTIEFPSLYVKAARDLPAELSAQVQATIKRLKLNDEETCLENRAHYVELYCRRRVPFEYLQTHAPFIARELERQDLVESIRTIMIYD